MLQNCFVSPDLTAGILHSQKFINTEVSQKYWNEAVTVIKTHNGGNRSNITYSKLNMSWYLNP